LLNVANQIAVIAIIAIGMTLVIITGGIDLSVWKPDRVVSGDRHLPDPRPGRCGECVPRRDDFMFDGGRLRVRTGWLFLGHHGDLVHDSGFHHYLAMMLVASGWRSSAPKASRSTRCPMRSFGWGAALLGNPNAVMLMAILYAAAHALMTRMTLGRYIYANRRQSRAARLSGVPIKRSCCSSIRFVERWQGSAGLDGVTTQERVADLRCDV